MYNIDKYLYIEKELNRIKGLLFLIALVFVFGSEDVYNQASDLTLAVTRYTFSGFILPSFFSFFDILLIILSLYLMRTFGIQFKQRSLSEKIIVVGAYMIVILMTFNPNNNSPNSILGLSLFSYISRYAVLFFITVVFSLDNLVFTVLVQKIFKLVLPIVLVRMLVHFVLYFNGIGNTNFRLGLQILTEDDSLFVFALSQILFMAIFLINRKKKYLLFAVLLTVFQFLSLRRSALFVAVFGSLILLTWYFLYHRGVAMKIIYIVALLGSLIIIPSVVENLVLKGSNESYIFTRAFGMFYQDKYSLQSDETDSGHFAHSSYVFQEAFVRLSFWGTGYGDSNKKKDPIEIGSTRGIHNAYIAVWAYNNLFELFYYLALIVIFLITVVKSLGKEVSTFSYFHISRMAVQIYFFLFLVSIFYLSYHHLIDVKNVFLRTLIFGFLLKTDISSFQLVFMRKIPNG